MPNGDGQQMAQAQAAPQPPPPVPDHLGDLRIRSLDTDELQQRTLAQARAALPQPETPEERAASFVSWTEQQQAEWAKQHPIIPPNSRLGQAYAHLKDIVGKHEGQVSEKYLKPFRESLDRMGEDLVAAGESGHTRTGGQLTTPARLMTWGVGNLLKMVPVGQDVQSTIAANVVPPEFPEGKALSKELKATEKIVHEPVGLHVDDLPRRSKYPDVSFSAQDLQDSAKTVTADTIRKDYAGGKDGLLEYDRSKKGWRSHQPSVYQVYIPIEDLPSPKFVEEGEENFDRSDYSRPRVGVPIKVEVSRDGKLSILDGNHRAKVWEEQGHEYAPRRGKIFVRPVVTMLDARST